MNRCLIGVLLAVQTIVPVVASGQGGAQLYREKKYQDAEVALREEIQSDPNNAEVQYYLGVALLELGKYGESEPYLKEALPRIPAAHIGLARAHMMQDRLMEALAELKAAEKQESKNPDLYRYRGMILLKQNQFKEAAGQLTQAVELEPKDAYAHYYLGMANSRLKRTDLMIKHFELFLELAPKAPEAEKVRSLLRSL